MKDKTIEKITLAGGCFWCIEGIFEQLKGVISVTSGYTGGNKENPTYEEVCTGKTAHAEAVQIQFDTKVISLEEILKVFWLVHDPTQLNRQGADIGTQYRSAVFCENEDQIKVVFQSIEKHEKEKLYKGKFTTEVLLLSKFYTAEKYHEKYYQNNPNQPYCSAVVSPKIQKFRKTFAEKIKKEFI